MAFEVAILMDADSFALMVASRRELSGPVRGLRRKRALWVCATCYRDGMSQAELEDAAAKEYGSVIALFIIEAFVGGIISWAAQKLMEWLTDRKNGCGATKQKLEVIAEIQAVALKARNR